MTKPQLNLVTAIIKQHHHSEHKHAHSLKSQVKDQSNIDTHTHTHHVMQTITLLFSAMLSNNTSCHSTDSERLHHCCHLLNNFGSRWIFPILHNGPEDATKLPLPLGEFRLPSNTRFQVLTPTTTHNHGHYTGPRPKLHLNRFSHFSTFWFCTVSTGR